MTGRTGHDRHLRECPLRIAVIGAGISGLLAARLLSTRHEVTLIERCETLGGHARTVDVDMDGSTFQADVGFMVFNRRTYPNFSRMLDLLGVATQTSDMSFSVHSEIDGLEYQGSSLNGLFAQRKNLLRPSFWRMLVDIVRFNRRGRRAIAAGQLNDGQTVGEFVERCNGGASFRGHYLGPMAGAIWSTDPARIFEFPARFLLGFMKNHGLLQLADRPEWRTIAGGSRSYVEALLRGSDVEIVLGNQVKRIVRREAGVSIEFAEAASEAYDEIVLACHADAALRLLDEPTPAEKEVLGAFPYQPNRAVLHTDLRMLPESRRCWASWNYRLPRDAEGGASVTYDLSRLQQIPTQRPLLLTLNDRGVIDRDKVIQQFQFRHPAYTARSIGAQQRHRLISGRRRTHYCGAYWGFGFHEDGVNSALRIARDFDIGLDSCIAASTKGQSPTYVAVP